MATMMPWYGISARMGSARSPRVTSFLRGFGRGRVRRGRKARRIRVVIGNMVPACVPVLSRITQMLVLAIYLGTLNLLRPPCVWHSPPRLFRMDHGWKQVRSRQLLAGLFHISRTSLEAWASITEAFAHGLAQPDGEVTRLAGAWSNTDANGSNAFDVTPNSYQSYVKDLQDKMNHLVGELMRDGLEEEGSPRAGPSLAEKDLAAYRLAVTPCTYLQVVGQKLLHHAAHQIPGMAELPERIPDWALRSLYSGPFAEAVKLALQHGIANINEAFGPCGEGPGERVRGNQLARSLLQSRADCKNDPKRPEPRRQQQQQQLLQREDTAASHSGVLGVLQLASSSAVQSGAAGTRDGKGDACQRALSHARSAMELLAEVERDIQGFERGFIAILQGSANFPRRPGSLGKLQQQQQRPVPPQCLTAYMSVVREDVARAFRDISSTLRTFLYDSVTSAAQICLDVDDPYQLPCPVPLTSDTWPPQGDVWQPLNLSAGQVRCPVRAQARGDDARGRIAPSSNSSSSSSLISSREPDDFRSSAATRGVGDPCTVPGRRAEGAAWTGDRNVPLLIDALSHRILELVSWTTIHLEQLPEAMQGVLVGAALECLSLLMDRLSFVCTNLNDMPGNSPLQLAFLFHSAACCVRRRLEAMQPWLVTAATGRPHDGQDVELVRQHGEALVQADELIVSIREHIILVYMQVMYDVVLSSVDRTNWCAFRPDVMRGQGAGPAVRVWHSMTLRLLYTAALHASPSTAEWILGQVLLESVSCLKQRYLQLGPTVQMLREFVGDAVHLTASVFLFCQPIPVTALLPRAGGARVEHGAGWAPRTQDSETNGAKTEVFSLRVPFPMARALAGSVRELLTRAALLHLPGGQLEEVARKAGLLAGTDAAGEEEPASEEPDRLMPASASRKMSATGSVRLAPLPALRLSRVEAVPLGGNGAKPPLPGAPLAQAQATSAPDAAAATASSSARESHSRSIAEDSALTAVVAAAAETGSWEPSDGNTAPAGSTAPEGRTAPADSTAPEGAFRGRGMVDTIVTDEHRLELWSSWLSSGVVRALTGSSEALELGGGRHAINQLLIPLGNRMADATPAGRGGRDGPTEAEGPLWRSCLEQLAFCASAEEVVLALARRHELHAAVGTEPSGNAESRRVVRGIARQLGLLTGDAEDG
ncbi:hypothetical protein Vretifemale_13803 [Volvox reticuliferus]|uniref:Uncharacterized protein n=1 Tax=Volvox reticuliferus TaxID=1737510 RepID=A0A8J4CRN1_9CHLO|nr:hypothetical protein Vretifemale_13803 [Volvox reticuliferus]